MFPLCLHVQLYNLQWVWSSFLDLPCASRHCIIFFLVLLFISKLSWALYFKIFQFLVHFLGGTGEEVGSNPLSFFLHPILLCSCKLISSSWDCVATNSAKLLKNFAKIWNDRIAMSSKGHYSWQHMQTLQMCNKIVGL